MPVAESLKDDLRTYESHKAELLAQGEGKWVLIHDGLVAGLWDTYEDALQAGYDRCGLRPFLVKEVLSIERIHRITRVST